MRAANSGLTPVTLSNDDKKRLRGIGHRLKPVVTIAGKGLSEAVLAEIDRALTDHELIKIKLAVPDRQLRQQTIADLCAQTGVQVIQHIGHVVLLFRKAAKPDPRLSNLLREPPTASSDN